MRRPEISQMRVEMGVLAYPETFSGIIIRDEVVYFANESGALLFHVENHERVRAGHVVASIQDAGQVATYRENLATIDQDAVNMLRQRTGVAINEEEIARRNRAIMEYIDSLAFGITSGSIDGIFALGDTVRVSMQNRNMLYFTDEIAMIDYASARARALAGLGGAISDVRATSAGIFSNTIDGLEAELSIANMANIPRELTAAIEPLTTFYRPEVTSGDALFRIVRSNDWYIAAYISNDYAANWGTNTTVTLFIEEGTSVMPLAVQVHSLSDVGHGEAYAIFRTNNDLMHFIDRRNVTFRLSRDAQEGFKIPHTAIVERSRFPVPADFTFVTNNVRAVNLMTGTGNANITESVTGSFSADGERFFIMADSGRLRVGDTLIRNQELLQLEEYMSEIPARFVFDAEGGWAVSLMMVDNVIVTQRVSGNFNSSGSVFLLAENSNSLRSGDILVIEEAHFRLEVVDTVKGVFVTNIGATQLREVSLEGFFDENADYIILDPARNPNLRLFDRIAADARAVSDRLLLH